MGSGRLLWRTMHGPRAWRFPAVRSAQWRAITTFSRRSCRRWLAQGSGAYWRVQVARRGTGRNREEPEPQREQWHSVRKTE